MSEGRENKRIEGRIRNFLIFNFFITLHWNIVDEQYYDSFRYMAK